MSRNINNDGFTLIEVVLASTILAILATLTWTSLSTTIRVRDSLAYATEAQEIGSGVMMKLREDIGQAFHVQSQRRLTFFKAEDNFNLDRVVFTSLAHYPSSRSAYESDQTEITYETESNPDTSGLYLLKRRESDHIDDDPERGGNHVTLTDRLVSFNLEYYDGAEWKNTWDLAESESKNELPKLVRAATVIRDSRDVEHAFEALISLPMAEGIGVEAPKQQPNQGQGQGQGQGQNGNPGQNPGQDQTPGSGEIDG
jgi:prepilin-type N-terminal cleavage/methylation domain-containing protein